MLINVSTVKVKSIDVWISSSIQLVNFSEKHKSEVIKITLSFYRQGHGLRTPNEGINQRYLKNWADVADKICLGRT